MSDGFLYFHSVVKYRVRIKEDGTLDHPEVMQRFTSDKVAGSKHTPKKKPVAKETTLQEIEVEHL